MTEQPIDHLVMRQRLTMMVNRYAFTVGDGEPAAIPGKVLRFLRRTS